MIDTVLARAAPLPAAYWRQWTASAISNLGDGINFVAMPLLALSLTDDERLISLTTFATFLPWMVLALPVGVIVDRLDRQHLMLLANLVRVALFVVIAAGAVGDRLSIWTLFVLLVVVGSCEVLFDSSAQAFLPTLVEPNQLARANDQRAGRAGDLDDRCVDAVRGGAGEQADRTERRALGPGGEVREGPHRPSSRARRSTPPAAVSRAPAAAASQPRRAITIADT